MSSYNLSETIKTGQENLIHNTIPLNYTLSDFWRWSVSDILSNATRGRLAEFIVATATNIDITQVRDKWGAYDLLTPDGIKIEVKSAAYLQSWEQSKLSKVSFSTKLSSLGIGNWISVQQWQQGVLMCMCFAYCITRIKLRLTL